MAIFLPALVVLGGAAAALLASCSPSKDPDPEDPENNDPSATPPALIDSTPSDTYSDDSDTPVSSTATGTPWPPSTTPYFTATPTPDSTPEPTDDDVPTPTTTPVPEPDLVMTPGEFTLVFHLILPDEPTEDIIPVDSYLDGIARTADSELRKATDGKYGIAYYPDDDLEDPTDPSNRVVVDEVYSTTLYDQTLELSSFRTLYEAEMGQGTYDERFGDNAIHVMIAPNTEYYGQASLGYPLGLLQYNLDDPQTMITNMKTVIHEIVGHGFGQNHPHEGDSSNDLEDRTSELVTREDGKKNCDEAEHGEGYCDTEADPGINQGCDEISLATCKVQCTEPETGDPMVDANGDEYDPDTSLVMSYYTDDCAYDFSGEESTGIETTAGVLDNAFLANGGHYAPPASLRRLAPPAEITVDPLGVESAYTTLGSALRAGRDGVKIYLTPQTTYYENAFFAGIHAFIFGNGSIIDGMDAGPAIEGVSASLSIEDLTIRGGYNPDSYDCGGGISISDDGANSGEILLSLKNSTVIQNTAESGAGICASHGGRVEIVDSVIQNNHATRYGAALSTYNVGEGSFIEGTTIQFNDGDGEGGYADGGAISVQQQYSPFTIRSSILSDNTGADGGAIAGVDANLVFEDVDCVGNMGRSGGCFYLERAALAVYDSSIFGNSVSNDGPDGWTHGDSGLSILTTNTSVLWESETFKSEGPNFQMYTAEYGLQPKTPLISGVPYLCDTETGKCINQSTGQAVPRMTPPQVMPAPIEMDGSRFRGDDMVPIAFLPERLRRIMESIQSFSN